MFEQHKGEEELPSFEEVLRVLILCRRIEDRDNAVLPKNAFKNHKELKWLARLEDLESYKQKNHKKVFANTVHSINPLLQLTLFSIV